MPFKKTSLLTACGLFLPPPVLSQLTEAWTQSHGDPELQGSVQYLALDPAGGLCVSGTMGADKGSYVLTLKYDADGNELWAQRLDSDRHAQISGLVLDPIGNAYIAAQVSVDGVIQLLVIKYGLSGDQVWVKTIVEPEHVHSAGGLAVDAEGQASMIGISVDQRGFKLDGYTLKLDSLGNELWRKSYGTGYPQDVAIDSSGNVIVTGQWVAPTSFPGTWEVATRKYDPAGNELWFSRYSSRVDIGRKIALDSDDNVYVTGDSEALNPNLLTIKYSADGRQQWAHTYDGPDGQEDRGLEIALGLEGELYVAGLTTSLETGRDYLLIKYSPRRGWLRTYDSGSSTADEVRGLAVDSWGNAYVTGRSGLGTATLKYAPDGRQLWIARYDGGLEGGRHSGEAIAVDSERHVLIAGHSEGEFLTLKYDQEQAFIRGDCNSDGKVQISDAMAILRFFFLGDEIQPPPCLAACDVNGNGRADDAVSDAIYLLGFNFLGTAPPPPPFPQCGYALPDSLEPGCSSWSPHCP